MEGWKRGRRSRGVIAKIDKYKREVTEVAEVI